MYHTIVDDPRPPPSANSPAARPPPGAANATVRRRLVQSGFAGIRATRADRWLRWAARGSGLILTFHHVRPWRERTFAPNRSLEITPEFLDCVLVTLREQGFDLIALDEVPARLARGGERPFAALTFDDGYRDNIVYARPVLKRHAAPWAMFVVADFAEGSGRLWWLDIEEAVARRDRIEVSHGGETLSFDTRAPHGKDAAFRALCRAVRASPRGGAHDAAEAFGRQLGIDSAARVRALCADWTELRALAADPDVTIGSHTLSHPVLSAQDEATAAREIKDSGKVIAARLGRPVSHLAFPHGDRKAVGEREFALARAGGYVTGLTTCPGHLFPRNATRPTALPRISVNGLFPSQTAVRALLSGVPFLVPLPSW